MKKYHIRNDGNPGRCTAEEGNCPFGADAPHFPTHQLALDAYEQMRQAEGFVSLKAPARARVRESFNSQKNMFRRAALDKLFSDNAYSLMESWRYIVKELDGNCYICGEQIYHRKTGAEVSKDPDMKASADHIVVPRDGGTITPGNLAPAHKKCNTERADTPIEETLKDKPEMLAVIRNFQKRFNFVLPEKEVIEEVNAEIDDIWAEALAKVASLKKKHEIA